MATVLQLLVLNNIIKPKISVKTNELYFYAASMHPPGGILEIYMTGGSDGASFFEPKKILELEIYTPKKYVVSKFYTQKNT